MNSIEDYSVLLIVQIKKFFLIIISYICTMLYSLLIQRMLYCWCGHYVNISICSVLMRCRIDVDFIVWSAAGMMENNVVTQIFGNTS